MPVAQHVADRLEQIDREILTLLVQRMRAYEDAADDVEDGPLEDMPSVAMQWVEAGEEEGMDPAAIEATAKSVILVCRRSTAA